MGAFELKNHTELNVRNCGCGNGTNNNEVCIIAQKIFDQCRIQKCLTSDMLGPARAARNPIPSCNDMLCEGDIIVPPCNATDVSIQDLELERIDIIRKKPSPLQKGCWDIELKYVFEYTLEFRRADGNVIGCIEATNSYNLKLTLFGASETEVTTVTDLVERFGNSKGGPYCTAEGTALALSADLVYPCCSNSCGCGCGSNCGCGCGGHHGYDHGYDHGCDHGCHHNGNGNTGNGNNSFIGDLTTSAPIAVNVTLGLFTIVKLFRNVNMMVEVLDNCVPEAATAPTSNNPCGNFESMCFPMNMFSPTEEPKPCCSFGSSYGSPQ